MEGHLRPSGQLVARKIPRTRAPLFLAGAQYAQVAFIRGWIAAHLIAPFANAWG